jgi:hypothetical protein
MNKMFIKTPENGFHFNKDGIAKIEKGYGAKYMGYWTTKRPSGQWNDTPVDVFYQPNPDLSKGHSHYFGMYHNGLNVMITDAASAFSEPIVGILTDDGEVIVSRYRHDCVEKGDYMIDGGRDYTRASVGKFVNVTVKDGEFVLELVE